MNRETQIPLYRAKKIDSDEWIIGYYYEFDEKSYIVFNLQKGLMAYDEANISQIDPSTLAISFDGGEKWDSFEEVKSALEFQEKYAKYGSYEE